METPTAHPSPETLARLSPLADLSSEQLELLSRTLRIRKARPAEVIMAMGDTTAINLYLLKGSIGLRSADGRLTQLDERSSQALSPIAKLIPRQYEVTALSQVDYLLVDQNLLIGLTLEPGEGFSAHLIEDEGTHTSREAENLLSTTLLEDLENDRLVLPSLPNVAVKVGRAIEDKNINANKLASIIQTDPAITAKLIRAANSPLYGGVSKAETCSAAVVRLGTDTTHQLVLTFALRELFTTRSKVLKDRMQKLWRHSVRVSAICFVLAKLTGNFNAEHALLAGLLHDLGAVAILSYADRFPEVASNEAMLDQVIRDLRGRTGSRLLKAWGFPDDLVQVTEHAEDWLRESNGPADYTDLVIIAQLHCLIGAPNRGDLPPMDQTPAFKKLDLGELTPRMSLKILEKAEQRIGQTEALLRG